MKKNKSAFSMVIAMWLVLVMTMLVLYILEYMIPYSKNVKWIENSSNAFYQAENSIEDGLFKIRDRPTVVTEFSDVFLANTPVDYKYETYSSWTIIPYNWEWNSEFDITHNTLSYWNPIQLDIWDDLWIDWDNIDTNIFFKVPDLDKDNSTPETLSGWTTTAIINWQISGDDNTLNATWSWIMANEICESDWTCDKISIHTRQWQDLDWNETDDERFMDFYDDYCWIWEKCSLKFSLINKLELDTGNTSVPYLEYKFELESTKNIPLRYTRIKSSWKSYGFQKSLEVRIPQQTTNQAYDFTVFQ